MKNKIEGDIVECGVWRGGSMMATAYRLMHLKASRMLYLFDTFDGMSPASSEDVSIIGENAKSYLDLKKKTEDDTMWAYAPIERVKENLYGTQYPKDKIHFIKGKVENTLPHKKLKKIAILRLDTDWYNSTLHELETLFPLLVKGGVLIIDDYGHWQGARKAVDEYIKRKKVKIFLNRVDYTCRLAIKQ
ncbi:TylF/MycF/NovP-related O-methyltransferase [Leptospira sp. WS92.C1]